MPSSDPAGADGADSPGRDSATDARHGPSHIKRSSVAKVAIQVVAYAVLAALVLKLVPGLESAFESLAHVSWLWLLAAVALEIGSGMGYVLSWQAIVDPENTLAQHGAGTHMAMRLAWTQMGASTLVPAGSVGQLGAGAVLLHQLGMPTQRIAERQLSLSFLNTGIDALTLIGFGLALATGLLPGSSDLRLTLLPAALAAFLLVAVLLLARRARSNAQSVRARHPKLATWIAPVADAVANAEQLVFHGVRVKAVLGALAYLWCDVLVLWTAFSAIHAKPMPGIGVVVLAYVIGALGGSIPGLGGAGAAGGMAGMLILYGVRGSTAVAAVVLYQAVVLIVPLIGGGVAFLLVRRQLHPIEGESAERSSAG